jgi:hypothetical protein
MLDLEAIKVRAEERYLDGDEVAELIAEVERLRESRFKWIGCKSPNDILVVSAEVFEDIRHYPWPNSEHCGHHHLVIRERAAFKSPDKLVEKID